MQHIDELRRLQGLPLELRQRPQWLLAGPNEKGELKVPLSVSVTGNVCPGSSTDRSTWLDYDYALECAAEHGYGVGYVLAADDPFTCVDFDVKNTSNAPDKPEAWTSEDDLRRMHMLVEDLNSYTELSQSGQGVHVWCYGKIGEGLKRQGVELYSQERFMACTGRVIHDLPIADRQDELSQMAAAMREAGAAQRAATLQDAVGDEEPDDAVLARAHGASNADKFASLWAGDWTAMGYPSQSEADAALMAMLCFYSPHNEQCRRLFRMSGLGGREKALKDDRYLDFTLRLVRGRLAREAAQEASFAALDAKLAALAQPQQAAQAAPGGPQPAGQPLPQPQAPAGALPAAFALPPGVDPLHPPGKLGLMVDELLKRQMLPIRETAVMSVTSWLAGVCGLAYLTPAMPGSTPTGLNAYEILVCKSGVGKEQIVTNLGLLQNAARGARITAVDSLMDQLSYASAPALLKTLAKQPCLLNVKDEWGEMLQRMADKKDSVAQQLKGLLTSLYMKSSPSSLAIGTVQSEESHKAAGSIAFSLCGTTTPGGFGQSVTQQMMEGGFLSRFSVWMHTDSGKAREKNLTSASHGPLPEGMCALLQNIADTALAALQNKTRVTVLVDDPALELLLAFDTYCNARIVGDDESVRQIWNRAHLKVIRLACRAAMPDKDFRLAAPFVQPVHVQWAVAVVMQEVAVFLNHYAAGDIGTGDDVRQEKLLGFLREWRAGNIQGAYERIPASMRGHNCIPRAYLQYRICKLPAFEKTGSKETKDVLDGALKQLCDDGLISPIASDKLVKDYLYHGKAFRLNVA